MFIFHRDCGDDCDVCHHPRWEELMFGLSVYLSKITQYVEFDKRVRFLVGPRNDCLVLAQITDINVFLKSFFK